MKKIRKNKNASTQLFFYFDTRQYIRYCLFVGGRCSGQCSPDAVRPSRTWQIKAVFAISRWFYFSQCMISLLVKLNEYHGAKPTYVPAFLSSVATFHLQHVSVTTDSLGWPKIEQL